MDVWTISLMIRGDSRNPSTRPYIHTSTPYYAKTGRGSEEDSWTGGR